MLATSAVTVISKATTVIVRQRVREVWIMECEPLQAGVGWIGFRQLD